MRSELKRKLLGRIRKARRLRVPPLNRVDVTRAEYNRVVAALNELGDTMNEIRAQLEIQFKRIAQLQADVDMLKRRGRD